MARVAELRDSGLAPNTRGRCVAEDRGINAFTLIEMIGVLAIAIIMASLLTPTILGQFETAARNQERANLSSISNALSLQAVKNKNIPDTNLWPQVAATWLDLPVNLVSTNARGYARALVVDSGGWFGIVGLPYTQSTNADAVVTNTARIMLLSALSGDLPLSSTALGSGAFEEIWDTPDGSKPLSWASWGGAGQDLLIQRIDFRPLFCRVMLFNRNSDPYCKFGIDGSSQINVAAQKDAFYLRGSVLNLYSNSTLVVSEALAADMSRTYENGVWIDGIGSGPSVMGLEEVAYNFIVAPASPSAPAGANAYGTASMLTTYMSAYSSWAGSVPCFQGAPNNRVPQAQLMQRVATCFGTGLNGTCRLIP